METLRLITRNGSDKRRRGWADAPVPFERVAPEPEGCWFRMDETGWLVQRGRNVGHHTALLHVFGTWGSRSMRVGDIHRIDDPGITFRATDWVQDDPAALVPQFAIQLQPTGPGEAPVVVTEMEYFSIELVEQIAARQVWKGYGRIKGTMLLVETWTYIYTGQDAVRVEYAITNSDPRSPVIHQDWQALAVVTGEYLELDSRLHYTLPMPAKREDGKWVQLLHGPQTLGDSEQLLFTGWLLCGPKDVQSIDPTDEFTKMRISSLQAFMRGPNDHQAERGAVYAGVPARQWTNHCLAFGVNPALPRGLNPQLEAKRIEKSLAAYRASTIKITDQRFLNLAKNPGQTGSQWDFGAIKAHEIFSFNHPEFIEFLWLQSNEYMRPFHNREIDGSIALAKEHPARQTWTQLSHFKGTDSLGKRMDGDWSPTRRGTGYLGIDDQHRSQNLFNALYALTGSYALENILKDFLETDLMMIKNRMGADRAEGRLMLAWAGMLMLVDEEDYLPLHKHMEARYETVMKLWPGRKSNGPIKVLDVIRGDGRVLDGLPAWRPWGHAIAAMGYYAAAQVAQPGQATKYLELAVQQAEMITMYGTFFDGVNWRCLTAVKYQEGEFEGQPISPDHYHPESKLISISDSFWSWTLPAFIIAHKTTKDPQIKARAKAVLDQVRGDRPPNWNDSEWWAVAYD